MNVLKKVHTFITVLTVVVLYQKKSFMKFGLIIEALSLLQVGPAGAHFGLLACLIVEVLNCWPLLAAPRQALMKLLTITFVLILFGLLPWVDNFAHLFGFLFGFLLSYALLPFVSFGPYDRQKKIFLIWVCLMFVLIFFVVLLLLFYLIPIYDCELCSYFNCIPWTSEMCADQNINLNVQPDHIV